MARAASVLIAAVTLAGCGGALSTTPPPSSAPASEPPAATVEPTPISRPTSPPALPDEGAVTPGTYTLDQPKGMTIDVPAGWETCCGGILAKSDFAAILVWDRDELEVYADPCTWKAGSSKPVGAEAIAAAFSAQRRRDATEPRASTVAGRAAIHVRLSVPVDQPVDVDGSFIGCDEGEFRTHEGRHHQAPGQIDDFYVVDLGGDIVVFDVVSGPDTSRGDLADLDAMLASISIR